jgi:hypothetical protein
VIQESAWDRLAQFPITLHRIGPELAARVVAARLAAFLEPLRDLEPIKARLEEDALFPLGRAWQEEFFGERLEFRPREVINAAREGWRREQQRLLEVGADVWLAGWAQRQKEGASPAASPQPSPPLEEVIDRKVAEKMAEHVDQRRRQPHTLPPDADNLAGLVGVLLRQCHESGAAPQLIEVRLYEGRRSRKSLYHLRVRQRYGPRRKEKRTGLVFLATPNATSATATLRRLTQDGEPPDQVFLITDERWPLPLGAKGATYLEELLQRGASGFCQLMVTFEQYAHLDALQAVVGQARSEELEIELPGGESRPVSVDEVIKSHRRQGRYQKAAVLREVLTPELAAPPSV